MAQDRTSEAAPRGAKIAAILSGLTFFGLIAAVVVFALVAR